MKSGVASSFTLSQRQLCSIRLKNYFLNNEEQRVLQDGKGKLFGALMEVHHVVHVDAIEAVKMPATGST